MPDLIAVSGPAGPAFVEIIAETWAAGAAFAPLDPRLPGNEQRRALAELQPTVLVTIDGDGSVQRQRLSSGQPVEPGDALVIATSGTEGQAKAVVHTHDSIAASARATSAALDVDPSRDRWLACLPLAHIGGLSVVLRSLVTGTPVTVHNGFNAAAVRSAAIEGGATLISLVTRVLSQVPAELFKTVLLGGAAPPEELPDNVIPTYGMTETGSGVVYGRKLLDGCQLALLDPSDHTIEPSDDGPSASGQILVRGPMLFRGYRNRPSPFVDGGWFPTGDLGHWRPDGSLVVEGRDSDVIVTGGEKVWPGPIEDLLAQRPDVAEVALVGHPDPDWGHRVVAVLVPTDPDRPPTLDRLKADLIDRVPPWCLPKELVLSAEPLPRTSLGKLRRREIRA